MELGILLLVNDKVFKLFLVLKLQVCEVLPSMFQGSIIINFLLANADLLKKSAFVCFGKTYFV